MNVQITGNGYLAERIYNDVVSQHGRYSDVVEKCFENLGEPFAEQKIRNTTVLTFSNGWVTMTDKNMSITFNEGIGKDVSISSTITFKKVA